MNKTIWMCWFQGEKSPKIPELNRECIERWKNLNKDWEVNIISFKNVKFYVPDFFDILENSPYRVRLSHKSDLLRLLLLERYGGAWVDASLYPITGMNDIAKDYLNEEDFFAYRYMPRLINDAGPKEIASFFLLSPNKDSYIIQRWRENFQKRFMFNRNKDFEYHAVFSVISELYDSDEKIKKTINGMVQVDEKSTHSFVGRDDMYPENFYCHTYKRPNKKDMIEYLSSINKKPTDL